MSDTNISESLAEHFVKMGLSERALGEDVALKAAMDKARADLRRQEEEEKLQRQKEQKEQKTVHELNRFFEQLSREQAKEQAKDQTGGKYKRKSRKYKKSKRSKRSKKSKRYRKSRKYRR